MSAAGAPSLEQSKSNMSIRYQDLAKRLNMGLPGHLGIELVEARHGFLSVRMKITPHHIAANNFLHAGSVVTLADTACGFGCITSLPEGANSFTTIELKTNFLRTVLDGSVRSDATMLHDGRRTQVWDAVVLAEGKSEEKQTLALFRCTQMILYPQR